MLPRVTIPRVVFQSGINCSYMVSVDFAVPKSDWPPGPWHDEPDRLDFEHAGLSCLALRNRFGAWCGYVAVPPGHPFHGTGYNDVPAEVHGGLTYASTCDEPICHELKPGQPDGVWWLGLIADTLGCRTRHHL